MKHRFFDTNHHFYSMCSFICYYCWRLGLRFVVDPVSGDIYQTKFNRSISLNTNLPISLNRHSNKADIFHSALHKKLYGISPISFHQQLDKPLVLIKAF